MDEFIDISLNGAEARDTYQGIRESTKSLLRAYNDIPDDYRISAALSFVISICMAQPNGWQFYEWLGDAVGHCLQEAITKGQAHSDKLN